MGGLEQCRHSGFEGNYISGNDAEGIMYETQLQRGDREQHVRPERTRQGSHQPEIPSLRDLPLRVRK